MLKSHFQKREDDSEPAASEPIAWPQFASTVSDFSDVGVLAKSFPTLFPYGKGDATCLDRLTKVTLDASGKHYLKYCVNKKQIQSILKERFQDSFIENPSLAASINTFYNPDVECHEWMYPFLKNQRFVHFVQNMVERRRLFSQRSVWLKKQPKFSSLSEDDVNGSNRYLYKKRNLLEKLNEQHGLCTTWFTLSMADNHWHDMHEMLNCNKVGRPIPFWTFSTIDAENKQKRKIVRNNPHLVDAFFYERVETLFKEVFACQGINLEWFWYRIEYQGRRSPHVYGCFRIKNAPDLSKHAEKVLKGRLASHALYNSPGNDFIPFMSHHDEIDFNNMCVAKTVSQYRSKGPQALTKLVNAGKDSEAVIVAWHDYFLSTTNLDPPLDAILPEQNESTVYNSKNPTFRHPSASDVRPILQNPNALHYHYCSSLNVQSRRKHCAYGDKNHSKQEQLKKEIKEGVNSLHKSKKSRKKKKKPEDIPVKCRFDFPKWQVYIQQVDSKDHDLKL